MREEREGVRMDGGQRRGEDGWRQEREGVRMNGGRREKG